MNDNRYKLYASLPDVEKRKTFVEIDFDALRQNYRFLCGFSGKARPIAVVKADAYGHGAPDCVKVLLGEGCDFFAVSCANEAIAVREVCQAAGKDADILILGYTEPELAAELAARNLIQTLLSEPYADRLATCAANAGVQVRTHLALDTGMNRIGIPAHNPREIAEAVAGIVRMTALRGLHIEGMFTHFARADEGEAGVEPTDRQANRFRAVQKGLEANGMNLFCHICNTAAAVTRPGDGMDGVRLGISLYGADPSEQVALALRPVMKLKTVISHLHRLLPGEEVSYGGTFCADTEREIATLPIGYADGLLRAYSGATVTVHTAKGESRAKIVGQICMDQCMLDVTGIHAQVGDPVTLFGRTSSELHAFATRAGTIDYECLCLISSRVPRVSVNL